MATAESPSVPIVSKKQEADVPREDASEFKTLVFKNLAFTTEMADVEDFLKSMDLHSFKLTFLKDIGGAFKGTVFVLFPTVGEAKAASEKIGQKVFIGGRKVTVQQHKRGRRSTLFNRDSLEDQLTPEEAKTVHNDVLKFVNSTDIECHLPETYHPRMRKYAHALAEKYDLSHKTQSAFWKKEKDMPPPSARVYLSKVRQEDQKKNSVSVPLHIQDLLDVNHGARTVTGAPNRYPSFSMFTTPGYMSHHPGPYPFGPFSTDQAIIEEASTPTKVPLDEDLKLSSGPDGSRGFNRKRAGGNPRKKSINLSLQESLGVSKDSWRDSFVSIS